MTKKRKNFPKIILASFLVIVFGVVSASIFFPAQTEALSKAEARVICTRKLEVAACRTRVDACRPATNSACLTRAVRIGTPVYKGCLTATDPQTCHKTVEAKCKTIAQGTPRDVCKEREALKINPNGGSTAKVELPTDLLDAADRKYQCGNMKDADDNVKTQINLGCQGVKAKPGTGPIEDMAFALIKFLSVGVGLVLVASVIYAGIQYSSSGGSAEETSKAKDRIQNAIIGLVFYLLIFAFVQYLVPGGLFN